LFAESLLLLLHGTPLQIRITSSQYSIIYLKKYSHYVQCTNTNQHRQNLSSYKASFPLVLLRKSYGCACPIS
jgi:hypothetical protein